MPGFDSITLNSLWHRTGRTTRRRRIRSLRKTRPNISRDLSTFSTLVYRLSLVCIFFNRRQRIRSSALEVWEYLINSTFNVLNMFSNYWFIILLSSIGYAVAMIYTFKGSSDKVKKGDLLIVLMHPLIVIHEFIAAVLSCEKKNS